MTILTWLEGDHEIKANLDYDRLELLLTGVIKAIL